MTFCLFISGMVAWPFSTVIPKRSPLLSSQSNFQLPGPCWLWAVLSTEATQRPSKVPLVSLLDSVIGFGTKEDRRQACL